jgi:uncharacterized membrane protein
MQRNPLGRAVVRLTTLAFVTVVTATLVAQAPASGSSLPPDVRKAFEQAYPGATISETRQERENSRTLFRVDGIDKGKRRVVLYDANGTAIETAEQVEEKDLPKPVADAMHSHPRAIYVTGLRVTRNGTVEYRLTVRGTRKTAMIAKPDGTVVSFK